MVAVIVGTSATTVAVALAPAAHADQAITSATGPLTNIGVTSDLNCSVNHSGDTFHEFYNDTACGTFLVAGGVLFSPASIPAGSPGTPWTPVSQTGVTGTGTAGDPFTVVTVADAVTNSVPTGLRVTETDSYVVGQESYRTDVKVANTGASAQPVILYRAGDCFLANSDSGYGATFGTTGAIACVAPDPVDSTKKGARVEQWFPLTPGSHYYEDEYDLVWSRISSMQPFADNCAQCDINNDNGAGLSWSFNVPAGGSVTQSHLTSFSPTGVVPLTTAKTADSASATAGGSDGYTITINNAGAADVPLTQVTDTLPAGFSYAAGSTTGATTTDPTVSGQTLTWNLANVTATHGQSVSLHFGVTIACATAAATYDNSAGGTATGTPVVPVTDTAPVSVSGQAANCGGGTPTPDAMSLSVSPAATQYSDAATLSATLTDTTTGQPLANTPVSLTLGASSFPANTNASGVATATVTQVLSDPGMYPIGASYAGDTTHASATGGNTLTVTKEDCTLAYTGALTVPSGGSIALSAQFGELDATHGAWGGKAVDFLLTDASNATVGDPTAATSSGGVAQATQSLPAGVYAVTARFGSDTDYTACASSGNDLVTVASPGAKVTGGGFIVSGGHVSFGFNASSDGTTLAGQLQVRPRPHDRFHGSTVTSLTVSGTTATWSGNGRWDGVSGYTFSVTVNDRGTGGRPAADTFAVTIRNSAGAVVYSTSGALRGGNITIH